MDDSQGMAQSEASRSGMPERTDQMGLDPDLEFTKMQLDFLDSQTLQSLEQFQRDWIAARYGDGPYGGGGGSGGGAANVSQENEEYEEDEQGGASGKKRPTKKKPGSAGAAKKAKKERPARVVLPPLREHGFGDLTRFAPPPKNPASSFMQFSRKYRAGKERGKAPNARHVSETWNQMSEEQRKPFVDLAEEDKRRVQAEIDVYMAQYPDDLKTLDDFKLLVSVMREKEKRDRELKGLRATPSMFEDEEEEDQ